MSKFIQKSMLFLMTIFLILFAACCTLMFYYKVKIPYGTWINDIYCTGMSYQQAEAALLEQGTYTVFIDVTDCDQNVYHIEPDADTYRISYAGGLQKAVTSYGLSELLQEKHITQPASVSVVRETWQAYIKEQPFMQQKDTGLEERLRIVKGEDGFILIDETEAVLDVEKASDVILQAIETGQTKVSLVEAGCYYQKSYSEAEKAMLAEYEALQEFCNRMVLELTIQGEVVETIDWKVLADWILLDEQEHYVYGKEGSLSLDESKVQEFVQALYEQLTTYWGKDWEFVNHDGETIQVPAGNFGRVLKSASLTEAILKAFKNGTTGSYELEFVFYPESASAVSYGAGVGDSYVEVDIQNQHVYLYIDGVCELDSPCVTGTVSKQMDTPTGVFYIEYKQRNRTLRGENYATPVSYWMHFYNHCGFHDAGWRKSFGGSIYEKNGSHGCVNMPPAKAKALYEQVYAGMPVVIY